MFKGIFKSKSEEGRKRKQDEEYIKGYKKSARIWWETIKQIYYILLVNGNVENIGIEKGKETITEKGIFGKTKNTTRVIYNVIVSDELRKESETNRKKIELRKKIISILLLIIAIIGVGALIYAVNKNNFWYALITAAIYSLVLIIYKVVRFIVRKKVKKYNNERRKKKQTIEKAIEIFANVNGYTQEYVYIYLLKYYEKSRRQFLLLYGEQILGIAVTALLFPGISDLLKDEMFLKIVEALKNAFERWGLSYLFNQDNWILTIQLSLFAVAFFIMSFMLCVILQIPANILVNEITNIKSTDELYNYFKEGNIIIDRIKKKE